MQYHYVIQTVFLEQGHFPAITRLQPNAGLLNTEAGKDVIISISVWSH